MASEIPGRGFVYKLFPLLLEYGNEIKLRVIRRRLGIGAEMNSIARVVLPLLILLLLCAVPGTGLDANAVAAPKASAPKAKTYSHDAHGLEKEWGPFLKAVSKKDAAAIDATYKVFVIPDYEKWFGANFKKEDVEQLGWDYEAEAENGKRSTITMANVVDGTGLHVRCKSAATNPPSKLAPRPDAVTPLQEIPIEQYTVEVKTDQRKRFSFLANYVYVDGAFRYLGKGAYPFWSMPDASHSKH